MYSNSKYEGKKENKTVRKKIILKLLGKIMFLFILMSSWQSVAECLINETNSLL